MMKRLEEENVQVRHGLRLAHVDGHRLDFTSAYSGHANSFEGYDSVVLVYGSAPDAGLYDQLKGKVPQLFLVGAAWAPRGIHEATEHGMKVALAI